MRLSLRVPAAAPAPEVAAFGRRLEQAGFFGAWVPDSPFLTRELYVTLTALALGTERLRFGPGVTNIASRHVSVTASAMAALQECGGGRARLGLGTGESAVHAAGLRKARLRELETGVQHVRALCRGETVDFGAGPAGFSGRRPQDVPVIVAASGPRTLRLAGRIADGVLLHVGTHPAAIGEAMQQVAAGAAEAGRSLADLHIAAMAYAWESEEVADALPLLTPICAVFLRQNRQIFSWMGWAEGDTPLPPATGADLWHQDDPAAAVSAASGLTAAVVARFARDATLIGSAAEVQARLATLAAAGVSEVLLRGLSTSAGLPHALADFYARRVAPALKGS